ncbi:MAG TPA: ScyD/ScyE family protein [Candidatus Limnocylindrales bacterium]|nr:ScyD/ScyE family protein [Candidatus Limnocylindrales bacterium]
MSDTPRSFRVVVALATVTALLLAIPGAASAAVPTYEFATPAFGLATAPDGSLLVADAGSGIVELRKGHGSLVAELPGVSDVAPIGRGAMWAVTAGFGAPGEKTLYRVSRGHASPVADLGAFEAAVNPDGAQIDSNPFDVAALSGGSALVADAAANALLIVNRRGNVDWVATLPSEVVSTANAQSLIGCPDVPEEFAELAFLCEVPMMPAEPVTTSVAVGPDGAYYVGELKGFPAPTGESRVWRIEPGTRHAQCGSSPACSVVADGFTSIIDLNFGPDGTLYVTELDESSWAAVEITGGGSGGTVNACDSSSWTCSEVATGLPIPAATTVANGTLYALVWALVPGMAEVIPLP